MSAARDRLGERNAQSSTLSVIGARRGDAPMGAESPVWQYVQGR